MPWGNPSEHHDFEPQRHDDGCIEVIGFTMTSLVFTYQLEFVCVLEHKLVDLIKWMSQFLFVLVVTLL